MELRATEQDSLDRLRAGTMIKPHAADRGDLIGVESKMLRLPFPEGVLNRQWQSLMALDLVREETRRAVRGETPDLEVERPLWSTSLPCPFGR